VGPVNQLGTHTEVGTADGHRKWTYFRGDYVRMVFRAREEGRVELDLSLLTNPFRELGGGYWPTEIVSLSFVAALGLKE
jgi:hypothetical protein